MISDVAPPAPSEAMSRETQQTLRELHFCWSSSEGNRPASSKPVGWGNAIDAGWRQLWVSMRKPGYRVVQWLYELLGKRSI